MFNIIFSYVYILTLATTVMANNCTWYLANSNSGLKYDPAVQQILSQFLFPSDSNIAISDLELRQAIYNVFKGKDYYTGQPITFQEMRIDHIVPKSKGGPDNIYNYVPTSARINARKGARFDAMAATAILAMVRTTYAPKVEKAYKARLQQIANERAKRIADAETLRQQQNAERERNRQISPAPRASTSSSTKVVNHQLSFEQNDVRIRESVIALQKFAFDNKNLVSENEIFLSNESLVKIQSIYPEFEIGYAFTFFVRAQKVFADGRITNSGGSNLFVFMESTEEALVTHPESTNVVAINSNQESSHRLHFQAELDQQGGHIVEVNPSWAKIFFATNPNDFEALLRSGSVNRDRIVDPLKIKLKPLSLSAINFLKLVRKYSISVNKDYPEYALDIPRAINEGHGQLFLNVEEIMGHMFFGTVGKSIGQDNHMWVFSNWKILRLSETTHILSDFNEIKFSTSFEVMAWLNKISEEELVRVLDSQNIDLEIELPLEATPAFYFK